MKIRRDSFLYCYGIGLAIVGLSVLVISLIRQFLPLNPTPVILAAVVLAGWYGGMGPGLVAALIWAVVVNLFTGNNHPLLAFHLNDGDLPRLIVLIVIGALAGRLRRANRLRQNRARQQAALARLSQRALEGGEVSELLEETARSVAETLEVRDCAVLRHAAEDDAFFVEARASLAGSAQDKPTNLQIPASSGAADGGSLAAHAAANKEPVVVADLRKEGRFKPHPAELSEGARSCLAVAVQSAGAAFGILVVSGTRKAQFTEDDVGFLQSVANLLSIAIERKRAETHLQNQEKWLQSVLNLMPTPMLLIEPETARVTFANRVADQMAGGSFPKDLAAEPHDAYHYTDAVGKRLTDEQMPVVRAARGARLQNFEVNWQTPAGRRSILMSSDTLPAMHGRPKTVALAFQDITRQKQIEAELQNASRLKDEFLATVSHELRTPLNAILGWATMLRSQHFDEEAIQRAFEVIERNARSQAQIIEDLLDVSRIITGQLRLNVARVSLSAVVNSAVETLRPALDAKDQRLETTIAPAADSVAADEQRLRQIVWNLLSNAVKFTPSGGRIWVLAETVGSQVEISVGDSGQGISPEFLPFVFDRFRQADSSLSRTHGGLGLGLAIVRHLVELHGGTITAASPGEGGGATFTVRLPLVAPAAGVFESAPARLSPLSAIHSVPPTSLEGLRLLIVDDDADALDLLGALLEKFAAQVVRATSAAQALEALARVKPDVLISDIEMPGEDGYSLIAKVRERETNRNGGRLPAIALTAHARLEDRLRAVAAGFQHHVAKPIEPTELVTVILSLTKRALNAQITVDDDG